MPDQEPRLDGLTIVITRAIDQSADVYARIISLGGSPCLLPSIEIIPIMSEKNAGIHYGLDGYDWLVFTSSNAVQQTFNILKCRGIEPGSISGRMNVVAVGEQTEKILASAGVQSRITANPANAATLLRMLRFEIIAGANILIPSSRIASSDLADGLRKIGARVTVIPVYDTRCPASVPLCEALRIRSGNVDVVTFASPSAVRNFISLVGSECLANVATACIGESTAAAVRNAGFEPAVIPEQASMHSLLDAISRGLAVPELKR